MYNDFDTLKKCSDIKPKSLIINDLKWKYLVRSVLKAKNIMIVGPSGTAKTLFAMSVAEALHRNFFKFNVGSTGDERATLIGNTVYKKEIGTLFKPSPFVEAITTENAVILLDEFTRGTHSAWNVLLPVLDPIQRCLRLDEDDDGTVVKVARGVCFIATCNVGNEYTATKTLDKALSRRFPVKIETSLLTSAELKLLFLYLYQGTRTKEQVDLMNVLADISDDIIAQYYLEDSQLTNIISPANLREMAELVMDGFNLLEIAECAIYPEYPDDGGADSERAFVKGIIQKYMDQNLKSPLNDPLRF